MTGHIVGVAVLLLSVFYQTEGQLQCLSCPFAHKLDHCDKTTCTSNEFCFVGDIISGNSIAHTTRCLSKTVCRRLTSVAMEMQHHRRGRRMFQSCDICCGGDLCNAKPCSSVKHDLYHLYQQQKLDMNTLLPKNTSHTRQGT